MYYFVDNAGKIRATPLGDHVARGRCSGLPECCIAHYVAGADGPPCEWGYRPCPTCLAAGNRVEVRSCADDEGAHCTCGAWASSEIVGDL